MAKTPIAGKFDYRRGAVVAVRDLEWVHEAVCAGEVKDPIRRFAV